MIQLYGINQCSTVKKAKLCLDNQGIAYEFIDYKKTPPTAALIKSWLTLWDYDQLINRRGTTWRKLPESVKESLNEAQAIKLMLEQPSIIKRPILIAGKTALLGFDEASYQQLS